MEWAVRKNQNESDELYHYGVKGMRWGVRKEYETKGRKKSSSALLGPKLTGTRSIKETEHGYVNTTVYDELNFDIDRATIENYIKYDDPNRYASESEARKKFNELPRFNARLSAIQQTQAVNHNAPNLDRHFNCFECTLAYEMRRRGYNVQANEVWGGFPAEVLHAFDVKDAFSIDTTTGLNFNVSYESRAKECYKQMEEQCLAYGNGARGMLGIYYPNGGGHAMSWVVENGEFKIIDNQAQDRDGQEIFMCSDGTVKVYRLDNADVLPGVTDFVEPLVATKEEKKKAKESYERGKKIKNEGTGFLAKNAVEKFLINSTRNIRRNINRFVSDGIMAVKKFFHSS